MPRTDVVVQAMSCVSGRGLRPTRTRNPGACCPNRSDAVPTLPRETRPPVLRARRGAPHFVRVLKYGAASRPPALPFSGPNGEGPMPKGGVRRAKGESGLSEWQGLCRIGRWQAGECTAGWFHATAQRSTPSRRPHRIPLRRGVTWRLCVRSGCRDLSPVEPADRRPPPFRQHALGFRVSGACCPNRSDAVPTLPRETRPPVLRARRGAPHFVRVLKYGAASRPPALPFSKPNSEGPTPKGEGRRRVVRMARAVSDRTLAGRRTHGGLVPRNGAKKDAKPPATKNLLAAWRTWRLCVRSGCRDLSPVGAHRSEAAALWATRPRNSGPVRARPSPFEAFFLLTESGHQRPRIGHLILSPQTATAGARGRRRRVDRRSGLPSRLA